MSQSIQCVHCKAILKLSAAVPAGKKIKCPKCKEVFTPSSEESIQPATKPAAAGPKRNDPDEEPTQAKKKRRDETDDDEKPRSKRTRRDEEDDDDDDTPRSRKKQRDEEDEEEEVRESLSIKKKKKKKRSPVLLLVILFGGAFGLFACLGCVGLGFYLRPGPTVVGTWDAPNIFGGIGKLNYTFRPDGTGVIDGPAATVHLTYTVKKADPPVLEWKITRADPKNNIPMLMNPVGVTERFNIRFEGETMTITPLNNLINIPQTLTRVKK